MSKITSSLLLLAGILVLVYGANLSFGHGSDWSSHFDWSHRDGSKWLLIAGLFTAAIGIVGLLRSPKAL